MIDFSNLKEITIPEGVVTQIADASGRILWEAISNKVVLQVEKIISNTLGGDTTYENEEFILLDIYPKTNGTVSVTYGGLTKTITDTSGVEEPNAQQVFFGTFNGVSDSVTTPTSGELTIEGDYYAFGCSVFNTGGLLKFNRICNCVKSVDDFGNSTIIPEQAFGYWMGGGCSFTTVTIPNSISKIGAHAFRGCSLLQTATIGKRVISIGTYAFQSAGSQNGHLTVIMQGSIPPELEGLMPFGLPSSESFSLKEIIVPKGCGNAYKTAEGWTTYADLIVEAS